MVEAAALPTAYMTAYHMLRRVEAGSTDLMFIPNTTSGIGVAGVRLAAILGAHSIGTSSSQEKLSYLESLGLDYAIESTDPNEIRDAVTDIGSIDGVLNHSVTRTLNLGWTSCGAVVVWRFVGEQSVEARDRYPRSFHRS